MNLFANVVIWRESSRALVFWLLNLTLASPVKFLRGFQKSWISSFDLCKAGIIQEDL